jgi:O-antigen ligase
MTKNISGNSVLDFDRVEKYVLLASVFFLPLVQPLSYICWGLLIVSFLFRRKTVHFNFKIFWAYYIFFFLHVIGVLVSSHKPEALNDLLVKAPLILFPVIFSPLMDDETIRKVKSIFCYGSFAAAIYAFTNAFIEYKRTGQMSQFYYTGYSTYLHPTLFTIFMNVSLLFLFEKLVRKDFKSAAEKITCIVMIVFFILNVYLASARLSQVAVLITLAFYAFLLIRQKSYLVKSIVVTGIILTAVVLIFSNDRFLQLKDMRLDEHGDQITNSDTAYFNSTRTRVVLFEAGLDVFKKHAIIGTGLADYDQDFKNYLSEHNYPYIAGKFTGPHTQYLETAILLGIPGLIMILYLYIGNVFKFLRRKNNLAAAFVLVFTINALGEYTLRASGILIFCLLITAFECQGINYGSYNENEIRT